jgi:hypothetical protein
MPCEPSNEGAECEYLGNTRRFVTTDIGLLPKMPYNGCVVSDDPRPLITRTCRSQPPRARAPGTCGRGKPTEKRQAPRHRAGAKTSWAGDGGNRACPWQFLHERNCNDYPYHTLPCRTTDPRRPARPARPIRVPDSAGGRAARPGLLPAPALRRPGRRGSGDDRDCLLCRPPDYEEAEPGVLPNWAAICEFLCGCSCARPHIRSPVENRLLASTRG